MRIRECSGRDIDEIYSVINQAAKAYRPLLPAHVYHEPQMSMEELRSEMKRIRFYAAEEPGRIVGVMGYEFVEDVALIRHAYVRPDVQRRGVGTSLLGFIERRIRKSGKASRIVVGTYAAARWAIAFYRKHGYELVNDHDTVLGRYYVIPDVQREHSVALEKLI